MHLVCSLHFSSASNGFHSFDTYVFRYHNISLSVVCGAEGVTRAAVMCLRCLTLKNEGHSWVDQRDLGEVGTAPHPHPLWLQSYRSEGRGREGGVRGSPQQGQRGSFGDGLPNTAPELASLLSSPLGSPSPPRSFSLTFKAPHSTWRAREKLQWWGHHIQFWLQNLLFLLQ